MTVPMPLYSQTMPLAVHVVIPAHNEEALIGRCLTSVRTAAVQLLESTTLPTTITVVADSCTDSTAEIAGSHDVDVLKIDVRNVGRARDAGVRKALAATGPLDASRIWIAMTDADSTVPRSWLEAHACLATTGVDLVIGPAHLDPVSIPPPVLREWWVRHQRPDQLSVHGANLGFTASTFLRTGGFPALTEHEDVTFVRSALDTGSTWTTAGPAVRTSGRILGRTPGGFAGYLRMLVADMEHAGRA